MGDTKGEIMTLGEHYDYEATREETQWLRWLGVKAPSQVPGGEFRVNTARTVVVEDAQIIDHGESAVPIHPLTFPLEIMAASPPPLPCVGGLEPWCWVRKTKSPQIRYTAKGIRIPKADMYIRSRELKGKVKSEFKNNSKEGEEWEENRKTREQRNRQKVSGSANLTGSMGQDTASRESGKSKGLKFIDVAHTLGKTQPNQKIHVEASWKRKGALDVLKAFVEIMVTGSVKVNDELKCKVTYEWEGQRRTNSRTIKVKSVIPVDKVNWHW